MPTANTTSAKPTKARKARRAASAKASTATRTTPRRTTRTKAARTRTAPRSPALQSSTRDTGQLVGDYAERAVLIPVGAALIARDRVVTTRQRHDLHLLVARTKTQAQLRRFERRGATARNRLEREVRKARVRVERELRQRRRVSRTAPAPSTIETTVNDIDDRRETIAKNGVRARRAVSRSAS